MSKQLLNIVGDEEEDGSYEPFSRKEGDKPEEETDILVHALTDSNLFQTMKLTGYVKRLPVAILIDSELPTTSFFRKWPQRTGCKLEPTSHLSVSIAEGSR